MLEATRSSRTRPLSLLVAAAALAGCASLRSPVTPEPALALPAAWSTTAAGTAAPGARWWEGFNDPLLSQLVQTALDQGTDVREAQAQVRQARALRTQAAAALAPSLGGGSTAQASRRDGQASTRSVGVELEMAWEPDLWGANGQALSAADADLAAQQATLAGTRTTVAAELVAAYLDLRGTQARSTITADNLASQQQTLQLTRWRAAAGLVSTLDVDQAQSSAAQTQAQLPALNTAIAQNAHAIAVLTGAAPASLLATLAAPAPLPQLTADPTLALPAELLRQRPDIAAAEATLRAAAARLDAADAARLPSLSLGGTLGLGALTLGGLGSPGAGIASLAASVSLPLLDGGRLRAGVQAQEAVWDQARTRYRATVLTALQEVEDTLVAVREQRAQRAALATAVDAAARAAALADTRYSSGLVDFATVLSTRRSLLSLQDSAASAATAEQQQLLRLLKAMGGGWTPTDPTN